MTTTKYKLFLLLWAVSSCAFAQKGQTLFKRDLLGVKDEWHKILLPAALYGKTNPDFSDIRILGINEKNDTIEAPYMVTDLSPKKRQTAIDFKLINQSKIGNAYYFTYQMPTESIINDIDLEFGNDNFDWKIKLEGSQNQNEWFTIVEDYRILSIRNNVTDFSFTKVEFADAKYQYFRLKIVSNEVPKLNAATIYQNHIEDNPTINFPISSFKKEENKQRKESILFIDLGMKLPVSDVRFFVHQQHDFYRSFSVQAISDSVKTKNGWTYIYENLTSGVLNSLDKNQFECRRKLVQNLKIVIENQDNMPLTIDSVQVQGYQTALKVRFSEIANYFLIYGNKNAVKPNYEIQYFSNKMPQNLVNLSLGAEQSITPIPVPIRKPFFESKAWLWAIMLLIIAVLGWFSLDMMKKNG